MTWKRDDVERIGYLVPEFPGQTHSFFWRELAKLRALGVDPVLISTRPPPPGLICHEWTARAMEQTHYLGRSQPALMLRGLLGASLNARGIADCLKAIWGFEEMDAQRAVRLAAVALAGAELVALARRENFRHVHVHSAADSAHVAMFARFLGGLTYSLTLHGPIEDYGPNQRLKWGHASFGIVITRRLLGELRAVLGKEVPPRVEVAPMGVDADSYVRSTPYLPWDGAGPLRLFTCGRLNPVKGHADLARAIAILRSHGVDARLRIAGEDDQGGAGYRTTLTAAIDEAGVRDSVELLGAISDVSVRQELERAHLFALASHHEPLGVAIMEAMALRMPVVVTSAGGVPELVETGHDGLLVGPQRPEEMAAAILVLARDPARAVQLGENARRKIESAFDSGRSAAIIAQLSRWNQG